MNNGRILDIQNAISLLTEEGYKLEKPKVYGKIGVSIQYNSNFFVIEGVTGEKYDLYIPGYDYKDKVELMQEAINEVLNAKK